MVSRKLLAGIALVAIAAISLIGSSQISDAPNTNNIESDDPRIIDWRHVHGVGFDPSDHSILYIATHGDFYQSINGGPPVKVDKVRTDYMAFNAPPIQGIPLYASGHPSTGGNTGLIKSSDGGVTWETVSNVIEPAVDFHSMATSKQNPEIIVGFDSGARGLFKTIDAGKTWDVLEYPEYISALAISPDNSELIYVGTDNGIFKSDNDGQTWTQLDTYQGMPVFALAFDDNGRLFASVKTFGIVYSDDSGESWEDMQNVDLTVSSIAADSENSFLYVGGYSSGGFQEVYKIPYNAESYEMIGTNKGLR